MARAHLGTYRCSRFQITAPRKPKTYPMTLVIAMSATAAVGSNGLTKYTRLDHMRPENEIENRLRPADKNKNRPNHMPTGD